ncbi:MAG: hypothetical protein A2X25_09485 [Chloroflexi bacterium GWB2_49_20]|nr:MAG: hypothetical protein A2X25_09485 [Chloroflexi bacterium GWB2_49_20]OGN79344.1 MAG: hypothetical protein A2X26_04540 [Chloroflexi bacterium GWC2_49_37]OGN82886.1 MAG: hypothetical protein A2X27_08155 [Chloroflexi bacterium GWD2_49_16]HCC78538.1 hypothetical protein [Anaerolineae bacterium]
MEGLVIGIVIWIADALIIILLGQVALFSIGRASKRFSGGSPHVWRDPVPPAKHPGSRTNSHRDDPGSDCCGCAISTRCVGWFVIANLGYPPLSQAARGAGVLGLLIATFGCWSRPIELQARSPVRGERRTLVNENMYIPALADDRAERNMMCFTSNCTVF